MSPMTSERTKFLISLKKAMTKAFKVFKHKQATNSSTTTTEALTIADAWWSSSSLSLAGPPVPLSAIADAWWSSSSLTIDDSDDSSFDGMEKFERRNALELHPVDHKMLLKGKEVGDVCEVNRGGSLEFLVEY